MREICVIFDLDGTLVDSETLCNQAFLDLLPDLNEPVSSLLLRYRGRKLTNIFSDLEARLSMTLPGDFEQTYRARVAELMQLELKLMPGVADMLAALPYPKCIASSGPPAKIAQALEICSLSSHFGPHLYSSHTVGSWKPEPDLFLHAAKAMGFEPDRCAVIEDSDVGVEAAMRAGMHAFHYLPKGEASGHRQAKAFSDMLNLGHLIDDHFQR
jgi:HAD superfamily hydrolase (TIGR01509 family)